jgi:nucleoid-associated protein YgaU
MAGDKHQADFSKVKGGSSTAASPRSAASEPAQHTYVVTAGDSLSKIAKRFYGDAGQWKRIFEANRNQLDNPDLIRPGQTLVIPEASA